MPNSCSQQSDGEERLRYASDMDQGASTRYETIRRRLVVPSYGPHSHQLPTYSHGEDSQLPESLRRCCDCVLGCLVDYLEGLCGALAEYGAYGG